MPPSNFRACQDIQTCFWRAGKLRQGNLPRTLYAPFNTHKALIKYLLLQQKTFFFLTAIPASVIVFVCTKPAYMPDSTRAF